MFRSYYWIGAAALGLVLVITPESQAQRGGHGGGGRGGGAHFSGAHVGGARVSGAQFGGARIGGGAIYRGGGVARTGGAGLPRTGLGRGINDRGRLGFGFGGRGWWGGGYGWPGYYGYGGIYGWPGYWGGLDDWPGYYGGGFYGSYFNNPLYDSSYPYDYGYSPYGGAAAYGPTTDYTGIGTNLPAVANNTAQIEVFVPEPNAQLWFNGQLTTTTGMTRDFTTPALQPGTTYSYNIRATWSQGGQAVSEQCVVPVTAGARVVVDFNHNPPEVRSGPRS
jgi:uncharacterized protein (TIGR03000 family)